MTTSKLDQLTKKREELNAQIQALKTKENQKKRKEDTKRKILIGGVNASSSFMVICKKI